MREQRRHRPAIWWWVLAVCALAAISFAGYQRLFSTFVAYDDEGYVMISLHSYLAGHALYDQTYTQYGPAYYVLQSIWHADQLLPLTHDVTRLKTLAAWLLVAMAGAWFLYRVTRQKWIALAALLVGFVHLDRLAMEPGHPQELCLLAITGCLLVTTYLDAGWCSDRLRLLVMLGVLVGLVAATKVNVGALLFLSLAIALLVPMYRRPRWRIGLYVVAGAAMLLPLVVARAHLFSVGGCVLPLTVAIALLAAVRASVTTGDRSPITLREVIGFVLGVAVAVCTVSAIVIMNGSSLHGLLDGLVLQHLGSGTMFYADAPIQWIAVPWATLCLWLTFSHRQFNLVPLLAVLVVLVVVRQAFEFTQPLTHGMIDRSLAGMLIGFAAPMAWVILLRGKSAEEQSRTGDLARRSLCLVAVLQPLGAFPIPGTQMAVGSYALLLACFVAVGDSWALLRSRVALNDVDRDRWLRTLAVGSLLIVVAQGGFLWHVRNSYQPLGLYGADRLRLPADEVMEKRWLASTLVSRAETFLCAYEAKNSLYFWTRLEPPTPVNANYWPGMLTNEQQVYVAGAFGTGQRNCVVWQRNKQLEPVGPAPLAEFLKAYYQPWRRQGQIEIWVPRIEAGQQLSAHAG